MIVNPQRDKGLLTTCGGRLLNETFELVDQTIRDPYEPRRIWKIEGLYSPIPGRAVGGIRAKVRDEKDFISFINQRDLEVLIGEAEPGDYCRWLGSDYVGPQHRNWIGFCLDDEDLRDDMFARELELRFHQQEMTGSPLLPTGLELSRRVHMNNSYDAEDLLYLRGDFDPDTGMYPDARLETIDMRWTLIERQKVTWRQL